MIIFLTALYIGFLALLVALKVIKLNFWWKLSPIAWMLLLIIALFIPMQFWAPGGPVLVFQSSVPIVPSVSGEVIEIPVKANQQTKKGDVLFKIDPVPYIAVRDQVQAQLELAQIRLKETKVLRKKNAVSIYELEQYHAQVKQLKAALVAAEYNLDKTVVRAPADGFPTNLALREGVRVVSAPLRQAMAFVKNERVIGAQIQQGHLRFVEPGLAAEVTFKLLPGKVFPAQVEYVIPALATGQSQASGDMVASRQIVTAPYFVRIHLEDKELLNQLPAGATGSVAIYSGAGQPTHLIRKVMIRMDAFMNFIIPS